MLYLNSFAYIDADSYLEIVGKEDLPSKAPTTCEGACTPEQAKAVYPRPSITPTQLGACVVKELISKLPQLLPDAEQEPQNEVGLVIGDSSTPLELTPSEGQRIAGAVGLKKPAYDIQAGSAAFAAACDFLLKSEQSLPEKIIWVSSNTPRYLCRGEDQSLLIDSATAVLFDQKQGEYQLVAADYYCDFDLNPIFTIEPNGPLKFNQLNPKDFYLQILKPQIELAKTKLNSLETALIALPCADNEWTSLLSADFGIKSENILIPRTNYTLASDFGFVLNQIKARQEQEILLVQAGGGYGQGYVILRKNK